MASILNIETATPLCSVALSNNGKVIAQRESLEEKSHASHLATFIEELLNENRLKISDLDAIAVGKGPGSYTGLRIGVSVAKGLCFGSNLPLIAISTLKIIYNQAITSDDPVIQEALKSRDTLICPMIDARRMEVFTCMYTISGEIVEGVTAKIIDAGSFSQHLLRQKVIFLGSGMDKCREVLAHTHAVFASGIYPHASSLALLSEQAFREQHFEDTAYFEPFYLKDFIATVPKKGLSV